MNYHAYIIKSASTNRHYYGHTSDLAERIKSHNSTQNRYTRGKGPWVLVGSIQCNSKSEAMRIEYKLKNMKNPARALNWIKKTVGVVW
ncbi:MAG: GIY-YIG nuclease family protein [Balneolaceae bacterium]|nr:GIY-YIG nuclease family protein [Balneolaceae bacterium]